MERVFCDTNILVYYFAKEDSTKSATAYSLFSNPEWEIVISTQVLSEFSNVLLRKKLMNNAEIKSHIDKIAQQFEIVDFSIPDIIRAIDLKAQYKFSFYDGLIIANALSADCTNIYSEDLHNGLKVDKKLKIVNPFKS